VIRLPATLLALAMLISSCRDQAAPPMACRIDGVQYTHGYTTLGPGGERGPAPTIGTCVEVRP